MSPLLNVGYINFERRDDFFASLVIRRVALKLGHYRVDRMIVHRLDMATSGVVIMARSETALKDLNRQVVHRILSAACKIVE